MVSGKYSALSGSVSRQQAMDNIANNLANLNSTGFKKDRISFESVLRGSQQIGQARGINYSRIRTIGTDFSQGALRDTGRDLDLAISGEGFFKIQRDGQTFFSRNGSFYLDQNGMLKTSDNFNVLDASGQPIQLPDALGKKIYIDEAGSIVLDTTPSGQRIGVFTVSDPAKLEKQGNSLYRLGDGATSQPAEEARIVQGSLETSNINMVEEMTRMIETQRRFDACVKVQKSYSTIGEKQSELGTVA
jgi:flagellar basal-body rod protein FlgF/flagellar basal-body rod protein FlgG